MASRNDWLMNLHDRLDMSVWSLRIAVFIEGILMVALSFAGQKVRVWYVPLVVTYFYRLPAVPPPTSSPVGPFCKDSNTTLFSCFCFRKLGYKNPQSVAKLLCLHNCLACLSKGNFARRQEHRADILWFRVYSLSPNESAHHFIIGCRRRPASLRSSTVGSRRTGGSCNHCFFWTQRLPKSLLREEREAMSWLATAKRISLPSRIRSSFGSYSCSFVLVSKIGCIQMSTFLQFRDVLLETTVVPKIHFILCPLQDESRFQAVVERQSSKSPLRST
jgi:hypothetical protein